RQVPSESVVPATFLQNLQAAQACPSCNNALPQGSRFCNNCGRPIHHSQPPKPPSKPQLSNPQDLVQRLRQEQSAQKLRERFGNVITGFLICFVAIVAVTVFVRSAYRPEKSRIGRTGAVTNPNSKSVMLLADEQA